MAKKGRFKKILFSLFWVIFLTILISLIGYINFEFQRLKALNLDITQDWRGYLAFLVQKIPILKNKIKYKYLYVGNPYLIQEKLLEERLNQIIKKESELEAEKKKLQELLQKTQEELKKLDLKKQEIEKRETELKRIEEEKRKYEYRINKLAQWIASSNPNQIAIALSRDDVQVKLIVDALSTLPPDVAAEIIQSIATVNPSKAASIISTLGGGR